MSKWVLSIIVQRSFQNPPSVVQNQDFLCQELKKLVASGVVVEVMQENVLVVNPLGIVSRLTGSLVSMSPAMGPVVRLWT